MPDLKALAADWQGAALNAASIEAKRAGTLPGSIRNMVNELRSPAISWREVLRNIVTDSTQREYSWNKPNRRFIGAGQYMPSLVSNGRNRITVAIDTSGSLPGKALAAFGGELQAMLDESLADHVTVIYCDSQVQHVAEYEAGDILKLGRHGGGGTAFAPVFEHMAAHDNDSACLIYFTDLQCSASRIGQAPACPVIWANWSMPRAMPFGDVIQVDSHA